MVFMTTTQSWFEKTPTYIGAKFFNALPQKLKKSAEPVEAENLWKFGCLDGHPTQLPTSLIDETLT